MAFDFEGGLGAGFGSLLKDLSGTAGELGSAITNIRGAIRAANDDEEEHWEDMRENASRVTSLSVPYPVWLPDLGGLMKPAKPKPAKAKTKPKPKPATAPARAPEARAGGGLSALLSAPVIIVAAIGAAAILLIRRR